MSTDDPVDVRVERLPPARPGDALRFLAGFLRRPLAVASIVPSSRYLVRRIAQAATSGGARSVVELGPGTGVVTRGLLDGLPRDARLLALELEADFVERLADERDPRLTVHGGDARDLQAVLAQHRMPAPEAIVSGIPFSTLGPVAGDQVLTAVWNALAPGGRFVAYQFRPHVDRYATPRFGEPQVVFEPRNVPPMSVYCWVKPRLQ